MLSWNCVLFLKYLMANTYDGMSQVLDEAECPTKFCRALFGKRNARQQACKAKYSLHYFLMFQIIYIHKLRIKIIDLFD